MISEPWRGYLHITLAGRGYLYYTCLLNLSKISAMVHIAILMLEFLSKLISLPKVFASFSTEQFLSVFAIILPYSVGPTLTPSSSTTTPSPLLATSSSCGSSSADWPREKIL